MRFDLGTLDSGERSLPFYFPGYNHRGAEVDAGRIIPTHKQHHGNRFKNEILVFRYFETEFVSGK